MFDHPLLIVGCVLLSASIVLAFVGRPQSIVIAMVLLGVVCCLIGVPDVQDFVFEFWGGKATVHMKQIKEGANDIAAQLGTINQKIQSLSNDITKQEEFNSAINSRIVQIDGKMNTSGSLPNPNIASNSRAADAALINKKLIEAGFQASSINSSLAETTIGAQPDGSEYIVFTARGESIVPSLETLIKQNLSGGANSLVGKGGPFTLRRGDAQIYLF